MTKQLQMILLAAAMCLPWAALGQRPSFVQEGFEGGSVPSGWSASNGNGDSEWYVDTEAMNSDDEVTAHSGAYFIGLACSGEGTPTLRLPALDLSEASNPVISFWYINPEWSGDQNSFRLSYRTSANSNSWTNIGQAYNSDVTTWTQVNIPVPNAARNASYFQLRIRVTDSYGYDVCFDDFFVGELPGCMPVSGLAMADADWDNMDFTFHWLGLADAGGYNVIFSDTAVANFDDWSADYTSDTFYTVYGLTPSTTYHLYVQTDCGDELSSWSHLAFTTVQTYTMAATGTATLANACGYTIYDNGGPNGNYTNGCNSTLTLLAPAGQVLSLSGTVNMEGSGYDELEIYDGLTASGVNLNTVSEGAVGPFESETGAFTIRYYSDESVNEAGFALLVSCFAQSDCPRPSNFVSTGADTTGVSLAWEGPEGAYSYELVWGPMGCDPDAVLSDGTNWTTTQEDSITLQLTTGQFYDFYVRTDCGGEQSAWRGPVTRGTVMEYTLAHSGVDTLRNACGYIIYDEGGATGDYTDNADATLILLPNPGSLLTISGTCQTEASYDHLYIYDGAGTGGTLLADLSGSQQVGPFQSSGGAMTIRFTSDASNTGSGFALNVSCQEVNCLRPSQLTAVSVGSDEVTLGWNENGEATYWYVAYDTTAITNFDNAAFDGATTNPYTVSGLSSSTVYYFYVASDCGGEMSEWSQPLTVQTGFACEDGDFMQGALTATGSNYTTLLNGYYGNSVSQAIYTATELRDAGLQAGYIRQMKLECTSTGSNFTKNRRILLAATSETSLSSMMTIDQFTPVWHNSAHNFVQGENEFIFDSAFLWDGSSNLCVMFFNNQDATSGNTSTSNSGSPYVATLGGNTLVRYRDSSPYTLTGYPTEGTNQSNANSRAAWSFAGCTVDVGCPAPTHFALASVSDQSATLTWQSDESASVWQIAISATPTAQPDTLASLTSVSSTPAHTFTGLLAQTPYYVYLRSDCGDMSLWISLQFTTECGSVSLPWQEDFNGYATGAGTMADCWTAMNLNDSHEPRLVSGTYARSGNGLRLGGWGYEGTPGIHSAAVAATPRIAAQANQLVLTFWKKSENLDYSGDLIVGFTPTLLSLDSIVTVATLPANTAWTEHEVSFASIGRQDTGYVVFYTNSTFTNYYTGIDDLEVTLLAGCPRPDGFAVAQQTADSIVLQWNTVGDGSETYELAAGNPGFDPNSATPVTGIATGRYTDLGVTAGQSYEYYVRTNCGSEVSDWRGPLSAIAANQFIFPAAGGTTNLTVCSLTIYDNGGPNGQYTDNYDGTLVLTPEAGHTLSISGTYNTEASWDHLYITVDGNQVDYNGQGTVPLTASETGSPITVRFTSDVSNTRAGFELQVTCSPFSGCVPPQSLQLTSVGTTRATLAWTPSGSESQWQVECNGQTLTVGAPTATLTGLTAETQYTAQVRAICGTDNLSNPSTLTFSTARCDNACALTVVMYDEAEDGWDGGAALSIVQSGHTDQAALADGGYGTTEVLVCPVDTVELRWNQGTYDEEISFTVLGPDGDTLYTCDACEPADNALLAAFVPDCGPAAPLCDVPVLLGATNVDHQGATIDWYGPGQNYEVQLLSALGWSQSQPVQGHSHTFTGLNAATRYQYRVRQDCDSIGYSDWAEDYFVTDSLPCSAPTGLSAEAQGTTVTLSWTPVSNETAWEVRYANQGDTLSANADATSIELTGLRSNATYTAWVRALCGGGSLQSDWSEPVEFSTAPCEPVSDITVSDITAHGATVSWTSNGPATTWKLNIGEAGHPANNYLLEVEVTDQPSYTITGLEPNTAYDVIIRAICGEGWVSEDVRSDRFRTLEGNQSIDQADATAISLYPNPASDNVTIEGYEGEVVIVDMTGRVVKHQEITPLNSHLSLLNLPSGAYFVKMGTDVRKLIVK